MFQQSYSTRIGNMLWACKPMLCAQALNVNAVETTVYQRIELSFGFSIPLHSWSYQRLTRLSSHQTVQIETDGKVFQFWLLKFAFKMHGETTCCARLVHPFIEELFQPNQHTSPIRGCRYDLQCKHFMARPNVWRGLCQTWSLPKLDNKFIYTYIYYYKNECMYK